MDHTEGIVIREQRGHYHVATGNRVVDCAVSSRLRKQLQYPAPARKSLFEQIETAVAQERYEQAAILRNRLHGLN